MYSKQRSIQCYTYYNIVQFCILSYYTLHTTYTKTYTMLYYTIRWDTLETQLTVGFRLALCPCSSGGYMYARRWRETIWESTSVSSSPSKGTYHKRCEEWKTTEMASSHLENLYDENHDTTDIQSCYVSRQPAMNYKKKCMYVTQLRKLHLLIGFDTTENKSLTCSSFTRTQRKNWTVRTSA